MALGLGSSVSCSSAGPGAARRSRGSMPRSTGGRWPRWAMSRPSAPATRLGDALARASDAHGDARRGRAPRAGRSAAGAIRSVRAALRGTPRARDRGCLRVGLARRDRGCGPARIGRGGGTGSGSGLGRLGRAAAAYRPAEPLSRRSGRGDPRPRGQRGDAAFLRRGGRARPVRDRLGPRRARAGGGRPGAALRDRPRRRAAHRRPARARLAGRGRRGWRARGGGQGRGSRDGVRRADEPALRGARRLRRDARSGGVHARYRQARPAPRPRGRARAARAAPARPADADERRAGRLYRDAHRQPVAASLGASAGHPAADGDGCRRAGGDVRKHGNDPAGAAVLQPRGGGGDRTAPRPVVEPGQCAAGGAGVARDLLGAGRGAVPLERGLSAAARDPAAARGDDRGRRAR